MNQDLSDTINKDLVNQIINKINLEVNNELDIKTEVKSKAKSKVKSGSEMPMSTFSCKCSNANCISHEFENSYFLNPKFYRKGDYYIHEHQDYLASIINKYKQELKYDIEEIELEKKKGKNVNIKALDAEIKIVKDNYMALINAICSGFFVFGPE